MKIKFNKNIIILTVVIICICCSTGCSFLNDTTESIVANEDKEPLVVTARQLVDQLDENALKADELYANKYIQLSGKLESIDSDGKYFCLMPIDEEICLTFIICDINEEHINQVLDFHIGQTVTLRGNVTSVGECIGYGIEVEQIAKK